MPNTARRQTLSVVIPCYNEQEVIETTYRRLVAALQPVDMHVELIFVDDGSRDATADKLRQIQRQDDQVRVVLLARNFGHQMAVTAGIDQSTGDAVVLIDADLQDPPEVIPAMVERWREGHDVVYGRRTEREGETAFKLATAKLFYRLINQLSETPIPADTGDFRLMDRQVVEALRQMPEQSRFLRGMVSWVGFRQTALLYKRDRRFAGTSKYPFRKMLKFATDGVLSFSLKPLKLATMLGLSSLLLALVGFAATIILALTASALSALALGAVSALALFSGTQLVCLGILGEYVGRIYRQTQGRPLYLIRETLDNAHAARPRIAHAA